MTQISQFKWRHFFAYLLLGGFLGCVLGYAMSLALQRTPPFFSVMFDPQLQFKLPELPSWLLLTFAGAFGGLAYAMRNDELRLPKKTENTFKPGWLADCLTGIAGAYVVILIMPGDFPEPPVGKQPVDLIIEVLATGIIGGYGGRSIIDQALGDILKKQEKLENKQENLENKVEGNSHNIEQVKQQAQSGAKALALLERYFDEDFEHTDEEVKDIKELIEKSSSREKAIIFVDAKKVRAKNVLKNPPMVGRTIPVFEALVAVGAEGKFLHRYYAQLGYALQGKNDPDWLRAEDMLSKAIEIRDKSQDNSKFFWVYEFNRAICRINLDPSFKKGNSSLLNPNIYNSISNDLKTVKKTVEECGINAHFEEYFTKLDQSSKDKIYDWLKLNSISPEDVGLPKQFGEMSDSNGSNESHVDAVAGQKTLLEFGGSSLE